jgi:peptide/nickel transport system substrate-binding protein
VTFHPLTAEDVPELCTGWEVSDDQLEIVFHLRRGVRWSDGVEFTSADVLFTYNDLILNEDVECTGRDGLQLPNGLFPVMTAPDEYTVQIVLSMVYRPMVSAFGFDIMPRHVLADSIHKLNPAVPQGSFNEAWGLDTAPKDLVGLGPFLVESYIPDDRVTMTRNPYYYAYDQNGVQLPYVDRYVILTVESRDVALLKFLNREIDAISARTADLPILIPEADLAGFAVGVGGASWGTTWVSFNQDHGLGEGDPAKDRLRGLFRDVRFRRAVAHAIDKPTIIRNLCNGLAVSQWSPVSILSSFYAGRESHGGPITERDAVIYEYDLARAAALLDEIEIVDLNGDGYRDFADGETVEILLETNVGGALREATSLLLADDLERIGLKINYRAIDFNTLVTRLLGGTLYQAVVVGLMGGMDPNGSAGVFRTTGGLHFWHYSAVDEPYAYELRIDELLDLGVSTLDVDEAFAYYKEFQILYATEDLGLIFTVNQQDCYAIYDHIGNRQIADAWYCGPHASNGVSWDLYWVRGP